MSLRGGKIRPALDIVDWPRIRSMLHSTWTGQCSTARLQDCFLRKPVLAANVD